MNRNPSHFRYASGQRYIKTAARHDFAIIDAVQKGFVTRQAIADYLGLKYSHVSNLVRDLIDADVLNDAEGILSLVEVAKVG
jgi:CRP-like cAMP-binding protein